MRKFIAAEVFVLASKSSYESRCRECLRSSPVSSTRTLQGARKRGKNSSGPDVSRMYSLCQSDLWVELLGEDLLLSLVRHFCVCHSLVIISCYSFSE